MILSRMLGFGDGMFLRVNVPQRLKALKWQALLQR